MIGGLGVDGELGGIGHGDGGSVARGLLELELEGVAVGPVAAGEVLGHGEVRRAAQRAGPRLVGVGHGEHAGACNRLTIGGVIAVDGGLDHGPGDLAHAGGDDNLLGPAVHGGQLERVAVILAVLLELDGHGAGELGTVGVRPLLLYGHGVDRDREGRDLEAVGFLARNLVVLARLLEDGLVEDLGANPVIGGKLGRLAVIDGSIVCRLARLDLEGHLVGRALLELTDGLEVPAQGSVLADYSGRRLGPGLPVLLIAHRREVNRAVSGGARHVLGKLVDDLNVLVARGLRDGLDNVGKSRVELLGVRAVERGAAGSLLREAVHLFGSLGTGINGEEARDVGRTLVGLVDGVVEVLVPVGGTVAGSSPAVPTIGRLAIRKENDVGRSIGVLIRLGVRLGKGVDPIGASIGSQPIDGILEVGRLATGVVLARSVSPVGERLERQLDGAVARCDQLVGEAVEGFLRNVEARLARLFPDLVVHVAGVLNLFAVRVEVVVVGAQAKKAPVSLQLNALPVDHSVGTVRVVPVGPLERIRIDFAFHRARDVLHHDDVRARLGLRQLGGAGNGEREVVGAVVVGRDGLGVDGRVAGDVALPFGERRGGNGQRCTQCGKQHCQQRQDRLSWRFQCTSDSWSFMRMSLHFQLLLCRRQCELGAFAPSYTWSSSAKIG